MNKRTCWDGNCSMNLPICCRECEAYQVFPEACDDDECTEKYDEDKEP